MLSVYSCFQNQQKNERKINMFTELLFDIYKSVISIISSYVILYVTSSCTGGL